MRRHGHPVLGAIFGLLFGIFLDAFLLFMSVLPSDSVWLVVIAAAGLVLGIAWGLWAPLGGAREPAPAAMPAASTAGTDDTTVAGP